MNKIEFFLDKIYSNGNSLYFYIILGGLALILILIFILGSVKPKNKDIKNVIEENVDSNSNLQDKVNIEVEGQNNIENTLIMKPITNDLVNNTPIMDVKPITNVTPPNNDEINKSFSPVYLDIKPQEESIINSETKLELEPKLESEIKLEPNIKLESINNEKVDTGNQNLSINPEIFAQEDNKKETTNMPLINNNLNAFDIKPNLISESNILDNKVNFVEEEKNYDNSNMMQQLPKMKSEFIEEEKIVSEPVQNILNEDIKPVFIDEEKIINGAEIEKNDVNKIEEKKLGKSKPIVLDIDDIKFKLDKLSNSKQDNENSNTLDELLKQIGMEDNNINSPLKDEEAILLGK
ncbi:MAG: hypothetical protein PHS24_03535 [Bacilli bacterium]|nr:hypothetical protein [Bacilli bacterium]